MSRVLTIKYIETMDPITIVVIAIIVVLLAIFFYYVPFMLWINAGVSGVHISLVQLFLMRIRKVPPTKIVNCMKNWMPGRCI